LQRTLCASLTARRAGKAQAWMIVQSFALIDSDGHRNNRADFDRFIGLAGSTPTIEGVRVQIVWVDAG